MFFYYEVEFGIVIGKIGSYIMEDWVVDYIGGYVLVLDMIVRDL